MKQPFVCKECKTEFIRIRSTQKFCCDHCRFTWHNRISLQKLKFADEQGFDQQQSVEEFDKEEYF